MLEDGVTPPVCAQGKAESLTDAGKEVVRWHVKFLMK
jgi:hypothetical protein